MGLSYTGKSCLHTILVRGDKRVPEPPAKIIPFIAAFLKIKFTFQEPYTAKFNFLQKAPNKGQAQQKMLATKTKQSCTQFK